MAEYGFQILIIAVVGLCLSIYAYNVETRFEEDPSYEPICDIAEHMSCSKAFMSRYGKGFGLITEDSIFYQPNSLYGIIFYFIIIGLVIAKWSISSLLILVLAVLANCASIYFAFILIFILQDFCIVCVSCYVVNALLLFFALKRYWIDDPDCWCSDANSCITTKLRPRRAKSYDATKVFEYFEAHKKCK